MNKERLRETHIIDHAKGNNNITKDTPNIPYLWGDVFRYLGTNLKGSCSYPNASVLEERRFVGDGDQRVIFLLLCVNSYRDPAAKLNEGKLCTVNFFFNVQILDEVALL